MPWMAVAAIGANIIGGIAAGAAADKDRNSKEAAIQSSYDELAKIGMPPDEAKKIIYEQFQQVGLMTPELEQHIEQKASNMAGVTGNKDAQGAQMKALQILQQRGQTGLTPEDRAALNQVRQQTATDTEAKRQQILQQAQMRGQGGGGAQLIAELQGAQSGANAESQAGDRLAAMASQNALQAIGQAGTLGGQIEGQQFGEQSEKAKAQDVINQFNTQNQVQQQARNVSAGNQAQQYNLGTAQNISNVNTQQANQELLRQRQAERQQYLDTLDRAKSLSNAKLGVAQEFGKSADASASRAAAPYSAVGAGLTTVATQAMKNKADTGETGFSEGGQVEPHIQQLRKIFPSVSDESLHEIHVRANPHMYSDGGGIRQIDEHFNRSGTTDYRTGGHVPGQAPVEGDSPQNDIVDAKLSPGEFVVKRSVAKSPFGKKIIKLLEAHSEVMKHDKGE